MAEQTKNTKVRVVKQAVCEDGKIHEAGAEFKTTATRAKALGKLVEIVK